jgi:hypothetical protein
MHVNLVELVITIQANPQIVCDIIILVNLSLGFKD